MRSITTQEELVALPVGSVIKDKANNVMELWPAILTCQGPKWAVMGLTKWEPVGMNEIYGEPALPAMVLLQPGA